MDLARTFWPGDAFRGTVTGPYMQSAIPVFDDFLHVRFAEFCAAIHHPPMTHRKLWEFAFIADKLEAAGVVRKGSRGLCFGAGTEQLPAYFASRLCRIHATDAPPVGFDQNGWQDTGQHANSADDLWRPEIISRADFDERVSFEFCDMNNVPDHLTGFDFCWSACCLEHLGSLRHGMDFIINSVEKTLKPGGYACHTTEMNLSSDTTTLESPTLSLFRRSDLTQLTAELSGRGHTVAPIIIRRGATPVDYYVDLPPYAGPHLKIQAEQYVSTSVGVVIRKGGGGLWSRLRGR